MKTLISHNVAGMGIQGRYGFFFSPVFWKAFSEKYMGKQLGSFCPCRAHTFLFVIRELVVDAVEYFAKARLVRDGVAHLFQIVLVG